MMNVQDIHNFDGSFTNSLGWKRIMFGNCLPLCFQFHSMYFASFSHTFSILRFGLLANLHQNFSTVFFSRCFLRLQSRTSELARLSATSRRRTWGVFTVVSCEFEEFWHKICIIQNWWLHFNDHFLEFCPFTRLDDKDSRFGWQLFFGNSPALRFLWNHGDR